MPRVVELVASREKPTISISAKDLPAIKNWKIGNKYRLLLDVEEVEASKDEFETGFRARFRIDKVKEYKDEDND